MRSRKQHAILKIAPHPGCEARQRCAPGKLRAARVRVEQSAHRAAAGRALRERGGTGILQIRLELQRFLTGQQLRPRTGVDRCERLVGYEAGGLRHSPSRAQAFDLLVD